MRYKLTIQPFDETRVLVYDSFGLDPDTINQINTIALKEEWRDIYFATLDDDRVGLVCRPKTFVKIMGWRNREYGKKFPVNLRQEFLKAADEAIKEGKLSQYKEDLTPDETELKKELKDTVDKLDEDDKKYGITEEKESLWEQDETE